MIPEDATRHAWSVVHNRPLYFKEGFMWNGRCWVEANNVESYSTPLSEPPYFKESKHKVHHLYRTYDISSRFD